MLWWHKARLGPVPLLLTAVAACAQTAISLPVTDSNGQTLSNGTYSAVIYSPPGTPSGPISGGQMNLPNIAALRALTTTPSVAYVQGYHNISDGGEGVFSFISTDITSPDNGGTIIMTAGGARYYRNLSGGPVPVGAFGAKGDGTTDDSAAINAALATGLEVTLGVKTYAVAHTVRFQVSGQIMQGAGRGYASEEGQTVIKWTGSSGGKVISFRASSSGREFSQCQLKDLTIEGNNLAGTGVEVYDNSDSTSGGNWRNKLDGVTVQNVTKGLGIGIEFGHSNSFPNFANDVIVINGGVFNNLIGAYGNGAIYNFEDTTLSSNSGTSAVYAEAGSYWSFTNCIFSANKTDFYSHNTQHINVSGGWYENSTNGIVSTVAGSTNASYSFFGALLHTRSTTDLMNFGDTAGGISLEGVFVPTTSSSNVLIGINPGYPFGTAGSTNLASSPIGGQHIGNTVIGSTGTGQLMSANAVSVANKGTLSLSLLTNNNTFAGFVVVTNVESAVGNVRTSTTYSVSSFQDDNTIISQISTATGSGGGATFTISVSSGNIVVTNTSGVKTNIFISAFGTLAF